MAETTTSHSKHRKRVEHAQRGTARAALLGVSDGLVTNVSLILGVAGAGADASVVRLAGLASLVAGACSMAVGEYISMQGQAELLASVLELERAELRQNPETIRAAVQSQLETDGVSAAAATTASHEIAQDSEKALSLYARTRLGINPNELGSPWGAAGSSFVMFSLGAAVPLLPWFFTAATAATLIALVLAIAAALAIGAYLGYTTGGHIVRSAVRQLLVLVLAAAATYAIGRLLHTRLG